MEHLQQQSEINFAEITAMEEEDDSPDAQVVNRNDNRIVFVATFCFKLVGVITHISDVGSDIANGYDYLHAPKQWPRIANTSDYNYTRELCNDWSSYRHPKMGALTMSIVWFPSTVIAVSYTHLTLPTNREV